MVNKLSFWKLRVLAQVNVKINRLIGCRSKLIFIRIFVLFSDVYWNSRCSISIKWCHFRGVALLVISEKLVCIPLLSQRVKKISGSWLSAGSVWCHWWNLEINLYEAAYWQCSIFEMAVLWNILGDFIHTGSFQKNVHQEVVGQTVLGVTTEALWCMGQWVYVTTKICQHFSNDTVSTRGC